MNIEPPAETFTDIPAEPDLAQPKRRHDGWSPDRQKCFLEALARTGCVKAAAAYTGLSREGAYKLRRRVDGRAFGRAWDAALIHARDIYADDLLDKGLNGWTEPVWHQGEEVGTRERWSPPLFLAALARLDKKADGLDMAGNPARVAAGHFDELVECIGAGEDCANLLAEQDDAGETAAHSDGGRSTREILDIMKLAEDREQIWQAAPEAIDTSDLDLKDCEQWDDLQWERAECSGFLDRSGFYDQVSGKHQAQGDDGNLPVSPRSYGTSADGTRGDDPAGDGGEGKGV